jgi:predicted nucleotidyltransferase
VAASTSQQVLDRETRRAAHELSRLPGIRAVCVIGSRARGDFEEGSDIDLLALVDDRDAVGALRRAFVRDRVGRRIQLKLLSEQGLTRLFKTRSTFALHVLREAVVVFDPSGRFDALAEPHSLDDPVRDNRHALLIRLELYEDLDWCQGLYLYGLSDLYSIGRSAAYTILGRDAQFEFSGLRALRLVGRLRPELAYAAERLAALRPFFQLVERNAVEALPFPYRDCHTEAQEARDAARALVDAIR